MFNWLGTALAATKAFLTTTEVAKAANGYLTSVFIFLLNDDDGSFWDTIKDLFRVVIDFISLLNEEGLGALEDPVKIVTKLIKIDAPEKLDTWFTNLLIRPDDAVLQLVVFFKALVLVGTALLVLKMCWYVIRLGIYSLEGWTDRQILNGETALTSPIIYFPKRFGLSLLVIASAPYVFPLLWKVIHQIAIPEIVAGIYGEATVGEFTYELLMEVLTGKGLVWLFLNAPTIVALLGLFLLEYALLFLLTFLVWGWMIVRVAQYGDGESSGEVITDTGSWAIRMLILLGVIKLLVFLTPVFVSFVSFIVPGATAFAAWISFLIISPIWIGVLMWLAERTAKGILETITLQIHQPEYTRTPDVVRKATAKSVGYTRAFTRGVRTAVTTVRHAVKV